MHLHVSSGRQQHCMTVLQKQHHAHQWMLHDGCKFNGPYSRQQPDTGVTPPLCPLIRLPCNSPALAAGTGRCLLNQHSSVTIITPKLLLKWMASGHTIPKHNHSIKAALSPRSSSMCAPAVYCPAYSTSSITSATSAAAALARVRPAAPFFLISLLALAQAVAFLANSQVSI